MAISLRLDATIEAQLNQQASQRGLSKSELIRELINDYLNTLQCNKTPWELGKEYFGKEGSSCEDLSTNYKAILKEKLNAKSRG